jgi:hypothetical protein
LTAYPNWKDRLLGVSTTHEGPNLACVFVTGNNVVPQGDTARRSLHVRIVSDHERPDTRDDFEIKDLRAHVRANRARYVVAALTIMRAYIAAGRPEVTKGTWGTFEHWHTMIAKPLIWLGMDDPSETRTAFEEQEGSATSQNASLLGAWHRVYDDKPQLAGSVIRTVKAEREKDSAEADEHMLLLGDALAGACGGKDGDLPSAKAVGKRLASLKGCVEDGLRVVPDGQLEGTTLWKVERVVTETSPKVEPAGTITAEEIDRVMEGAPAPVTDGVSGGLEPDREILAALDAV